MRKEEIFNDSNFKKKNNMDIFNAIEKNVNNKKTVDDDIKNKNDATAEEEVEDILGFFFLFYV
jgi:hypothetical protein